MVNKRSNICSGLVWMRQIVLFDKNRFKLFPSSPEKLLEFIELLWQLVLGTPMEDFTTEKDYSDPQHPKLIYQIRKNPLVYGMDGSDPLDKFPWKKITDGNKGYSAGVIGMMMAATSAILRLKGVDRRIVIYNSKDTLLGDPYFELACQIVDEIPPEFSGSVDYSDETKQDPVLAILTFLRRSLRSKAIRSRQSCNHNPVSKDGTP